ncbi:MAG: hypothetical protein BJ554DRAFT_4253, partial [Olpidium bornovanus]
GLRRLGAHPDPRAGQTPCRRRLLCGTLPRGPLGGEPAVRERGASEHREAGRRAGGRGRRVRRSRARSGTENVRKPRNRRRRRSERSGTPSPRLRESATRPRVRTDGK